MNVKSAYTVLRKALKDIIEECPNPKSSYRKRIVEIAKQTLEETE
jgi:hypothetical protein